MTPLDLQVLRTLLERMDVPKMRRDINNPTNVRWLLRNLRAKNNEADDIDEVVERLKTIARTQR